MSRDFWLPLKRYLDSIDAEYSSSMIEQMQAYLSLLEKWRQVINLTAHKTQQDILTHDFIDSASVLPFLKNIHSLCDVGTGAGFPGIPLAVLRPELQVTLVEANQKKTSFLKQVVNVCQLNNVSVIPSRVELFKPEKPFEGVVTRAYSNLAQMLQQTAHLCDNNGLYFAMKAKVSEEELSEVPNNFLLKTTELLNVPGFSHRTLYIYTHKK